MAASALAEIRRPARPIFGAASLYCWEGKLAKEYEVQMMQNYRTPAGTAGMPSPHHPSKPLELILPVAIMEHMLNAFDPATCSNPVFAGYDARRY